MILVSLVLEQPQFTEYDGHYFPGADVPITRLSEPELQRRYRPLRSDRVVCRAPLRSMWAEWTRVMVNWAW